MTQRLPIHSADLLDTIVRRSRGQRIDPRIRGSRAGLLRAYYADVPKENLRYRDPKALAAAALSHIASGRSRRRGKRSPREALTEWLLASKDGIGRARKNLKDMETSGVADFATLSVPIREIERLT